MPYLSLAYRIPEATAVEPRALAWFYDAITSAPFLRGIHCQVVAGVLDRGVVQGYGLDLGSGPGTVTVELARRQPGLRMTGLDLAANMAEKARQKASRMGFNGRILWPQADARRLPFADGTFDLVMSSFAMHHWTDPLSVLNEIARVLVPEGQYHISDISRETTLWQRLFAYASIPVVSLPFGSYGGYGGYYESVRAGYTLDEARELLDRSALPPGEARLDSKGFAPVVVLTSRSTPPSPQGIPATRTGGRPVRVHTDGVRRK